MNDSETEPRWSRPHLTGKMPATVVEKWREDLLDEGFVPLPKRLLRCLGSIFVGEHAVGMLTVVMAIVDYRRPGLTRAPSLGLLAWTAGLSAKEFRARLDGLEELGLVGVTGSPEALQIDLEGLYRAIREKSDEA